MGCDIHIKAQKCIDGVWQDILGLNPFNWRSYGMFAFLADVRNYSFVPSIAPIRGLPVDIVYDSEESDDWTYGEHSFSWLSLKELIDFDYDQVFEDRRCMRDGNGAADSGPGNGVQTTFRKFLGPLFFRDIAIMQCLRREPEHVRIVFGFDN